ncbi:MAG: carboxypeptidase-like regulatory domain-containing protein [Methanofollis sp.]|nr:carboxypeptidase-like regulatory domain-containing protein [Methanofollis sp.]
MTKNLIRLKALHEAGPHSSPHRRRSIFISLAILIALIALPTSCSGVSSEDGPVTLSVTSPTDGAEVWIDVVPPHVAVIGEVSAPSGIWSVHVQSGEGEGEVLCGNRTEFACAVPVVRGENTLTVVAADMLGNRAEHTLNVTVHIGLPPPQAITVSGQVTDPDGAPVAGATVRFESVFSLDNKSLSMTTTTDDDGHYLIKDAIGHRQHVTVEKEGYLPLQRKIAFEHLTDELDLELEPRRQTTPGYDLWASISALFVVSLAHLVRRG